MTPVPANARALTGRPVGTAARWRRTRAFTGLVALLLGASTEVAAQLSVDQLELQFKVAQPGSAIPAQTFQVSNTGTDAIQVNISLGDWDRAETGENRFFDLGTQSGSCGSNVRVFPMNLRVEPGKTEVIRVEIAGGVNIPCHAILYAETPPTPQAAGRGATLSYTLRYGVKIYVEPTIPPSGEIIETSIASASAAGTRADTLHFSFRNPGLAQVLAQGKVELRREDDSIAATIPVGEFPVLGGALRRVRVPLPTLPRGRYAAIVFLDIGTDELLAAQVLLEIP